MFRALLFFFITLTLAGCVRPLVKTDRDDSIPELEYAVISYTTELEKSEAIFLLDSRAYLDDSDVELVMMKFRTQRMMEVLEARDLIVRIVEGFLDRVNNDELIPLLVTDYPFTAGNLCIDIDFESFYGKFVDPLCMSHVMLEDGLVYYYANDACDPDAWIWHQRVETYDKAYRFSVFRHVSEAIAEAKAKDEAARGGIPYESRSPEDRLNQILTEDLNRRSEQNAAGGNLEERKQEYRKAVELETSTSSFAQ